LYAGPNKYRAVYNRCVATALAAFFPRSTHFTRGIVSRIAGPQPLARRNGVGLRQNWTNEEESPQQDEVTA
jgi:hypothetical protein